MRPLTRDEIKMVARFHKRRRKPSHTDGSLFGVATSILWTAQQIKALANKDCGGGYAVTVRLVKKRRRCHAFGSVSGEHFIVWSLTFAQRRRLSLISGHDYGLSTPEGC